MKKKWIWSILIVSLVWLLWPVKASFSELSFSAVVNDSNGQLLSASISNDEQWRFPIIDEVPDRFEKSLLTFEDKRYYYHPGVDPIAVSRAIKENLSSGKVKSGASTITMQLARMIKQHDSRSLFNKLKEVRLALRLEFWYSKSEILKWYTSLAPMGGNVVGLEAACWRYYDKMPDQLSWAEAATLAVLPNAPSLIHVNKNRKRLQQKRDRLLYQLYDEEIIDALSLEASLMEPLPERLYNLPNQAPHLLQFLKQSFGSSSNHTIAIDSDIQRSVADQLNQLYLEWSQNEVYNAGVLILDTKTGAVLGYHGNIPNTTKESAVDMIQARRSSGSILKPFLYAHMINEGLITPSELVWDIPTYIAGFNPNNYNKTYSGATPVDEALQRSLNVPAVRLLQSYGIAKFLHRLRGHGLETLSFDGDHYGLSLILGGGEVSLWDIAYAYRNMGAAILPDGETKNENDVGLSKAAIYQTLEALKGLSRPDEEGNWQLMDSRAPLAWKTGTSYGHRDAWAVGVSPEVTIATWVGNADGEGRDGIIGTSTAGRLMFNVAGLLNLEGTWFDPPYEEMTYLRKCHHTGWLASPNCPKVDTTYWPMVSERADVCLHHQTHFVTTDGNYRVEGDCELSEGITTKSYLSLPPLVSQYYKRSHPDWEVTPPVHDDCKSSSSISSMELVYPLAGDVIYLPSDLNEERQSIVARAAHHDSNATIYWYLNDLYMGSTKDFHSMAIMPSVGFHKISIVDDKGLIISSSITINGDFNP